MWLKTRKIAEYHSDHGSWTFQPALRTDETTLRNKSVILSLSRTALGLSVILPASLGTQLQGYIHLYVQGSLLQHQQQQLEE